MSLEDMQKELERYYINMENELLLNIAHKLSAGKPMEIDKWNPETNSQIEGSGGVNEWQLERLKELNGLTSANAEIIAKYSGKAINEVERIFQRAREIGTEIDQKQIELGIKAGVLNEVNPIYEDSVIKEVASIGAKDTLNTLNQVNNSLLASAGDEYKKIVNDTYFEVISGTKTRQVAMQESVTKLAEKGLTSFIAVNGAEWKSEGYINMVIRANTNRIINNIVEKRARLRGANYYEISSHLGARPLCSLDQGQIFSIDDSSEPILDGSGKELKVRPWSSSTYGKPAGILGINCRHSRHLFIPGVSFFNQEPIDDEENKKMYKEEQKQRYYERQIRNKKREVEMLKSTGAEENYIKNKQNQLKEYSNQYNDWLKSVDRRRNYANEWVGAVNTTISSKVENTIFDKDRYKKLTMNQTKELSKIQKISEKEKEILYTKGTGYIGTYNSMNINDILRKKTIEDLNTQQKLTYETLSDVIAKNKLKEDIYAVRYVSLNYINNMYDFDLDKALENDNLVNEMKKFVDKEKIEKSFVSASLTSEKIIDGNVELHLYIPKGTNAFITENYEESEIILNTNTKYIIKDVSEKIDEYNQATLILDVEIKK